MMMHGLTNFKFVSCVFDLACMCGNQL